MTICANAVGPDSGACRNPDLARERRRKHEALLTATEKAARAAIQRAVERRHQPLRGATKIALRVGAALDRHKMAKHFDLAIADDRFTVARKTEAIAAEAALDGIYVVRTSLPAATLDDAATVAAYKSLALVERAFRSLKTVDLQIRPLYQHPRPRPRVPVAYHVEWHLRAKLAPMLYDDDEREAAAERTSIVAKAGRSPAAQAKQRRGFTDDGLPVHSFASLLADLATLARNEIVTAAAPDIALTLYTRPTALQRKAFDLLAIDPARTQ